MSSGSVTPDAVIDFWCGELDESGLAPKERSARWWKKDPAFDAEIRERFGEAHARALAGELDSWLDTPRGRVACVILLDQFSRNMFRNQAEMYAADEKARAVAREGVERGEDRELPTDLRVFLYMPFMHSEELHDQERCVELFTAQLEACPEAARGRVSANVDYAKKHRDIVARFGRFPHRNAILGRPSTPEEEKFLGEPGSSF